MDSDHAADVYSRLKGNMEQIKRYASEIALHERSNVEIRCDGSIVITAHPRPLPTEIICLIINHLSRSSLLECALVTKQFYAIANPLIWQDLDFYPTIDPERFFASLSDASPRRLNTLLQHTHALRLAGPHWTDTQLTRLVPHLSHLKEFEIYEDTAITDAGFQQIPYYCQQLTSLNLEEVDLTQALFSAIGQHCHRLSAFGWILTENQSEEWLEMLTMCPLERFELTSNGMALNEKTMMAIKTFDRLTCLDIIQSTADFVPFLLQPTMMADTHRDDPLQTCAAATTPWPRLASLSIIPCNTLDDRTLIGFIKTNPDLWDLKLEEPQQLTDATLDALVIWLPKLAHMYWIDNQHITSDGVRRLVCGCPRLNFLDLGHCQHVSAKDFPELELYPGERDTRVMMFQGTIDKIRQGAHGNDNKLQQ